MQPRIALAPEPDAGDLRLDDGGRMEKAIVEAGGVVVPLAEATGLVWLDVGDTAPLPGLLDAHPGITWTQLPTAAVDRMAGLGVFARPVAFTCAKGLYGEQVGEHALMLILASLRHVVERARRTRWFERPPESLFGKRVTILGAGGIARTLVALLRPFGCEITVVRRLAKPMKGVSRTVTTAELQMVLPHTDILVLAAAMTPETRGIIGARQLHMLPPGAVLVNVARGGLVDTTALTNALTGGMLAAAGLDVTEPEPLPREHPLWMLDNALITSHCADSLEFVTDKLVERVRSNVERLVKGSPLQGLVDAEAGY